MTSVRVGFSPGFLSRGGFSTHFSLVISTAVFQLLRKYFCQISLNFFYTFSFDKSDKIFEVDFSGPPNKFLDRFGLLGNTVQQTTWCSVYVRLCGAKLRLLC
jgi:hypothetical protein